MYLGDSGVTEKRPENLSQARLKEEKCFKDAMNVDDQRAEVTPLLNVALIVNSCRSFYEITVPILLDSAKKIGVTASNIVVVVGEMEEPPSYMTDADGVTFIYCNYINIDYNAAIYMSQTEHGRHLLQTFTHFYYTHDTCELLDEFWTNILKRAKTCNTYVKSVPLYTQNLGLIAVRWFLEHKQAFFSAIINYEPCMKMKYKKSEFPNEDDIRQRFDGLPPQYLGEDALFWFDETSPCGDCFQNECTDSFRVQRYSDEWRNAAVYESPGIIKYGITGVSGYKFVL